MSKREEPAFQSGLFDRLATGYDRGMAPLEWLWFRALRRRLLPRIQGQVLEMGIGTGANLPFYPNGGCVFGFDESAEMLAASLGRAQSLDRCLRLSQANAEQLPFADQSFDTVLGSLVLCSVANPHQALHEVRRVLRKPEGRLLLLEHTRPDSRLLGRLTDAINRPWYALNGRCNVNRRTDQMVAEVGFTLESIESEMGGLLRLIVARGR